MATDYPSRVNIVPWGSWSSASQTMNRVQASGSLDLGNLAFTTPAINEYVEWDVFLKAGTWDLKLLTGIGPNRGIQTWTLDGVTIGTVNPFFLYGFFANRDYAIDGFTVSADGNYPLRCTMASKPSGSSDYQASFHSITLLRTGA